jgi:hypothetical protein
MRKNDFSSNLQIFALDYWNEPGRKTTTEAEYLIRMARAYFRITGTSSESEQSFSAVPDKFLEQISAGCIIQLSGT